MSIVRQGTFPVGSLDHAITLNVQSSGGSHFETVTDTTPYLHRASPQDVASSMKLKKVVGGTIAWNQLSNGISATTESNGVTFTKTNNTTLTLSGISEAGVTRRFNNDQAISIVTGHKYLLHGNHANVTKVVLYIYENNWSSPSVPIGLSGGIVSASSTSSTARFCVSIATNIDVNGIILVPQLFDLTQMFGSTIADYIYSLEQAHAGDGVAWFKSLFPKAYYSYNAGELISVKTSARKTYNADNVEIGSYPLDGDLELRGIPKLDGNNELYYDGDTYASDGTVTRRYGVVDLGTLNWVSDSTSTTGKNRFFADLPNSVASDSDANGVHSVISNGIKVLINAGTYYASSDGYTITILGKIYIFMDSLSTGTESAFKTAMSGVYLVYELATPTTESADAYTQAQRVGATEEFVDGRTVEIPVGNVSEYKRLIQGDTP